MYKNYIALYLVVLAAAALADNGAVFQPLQNSDLLKKSRHWEGLGLTATVNDYVDDTIAKVVPFIQEHGLDPMQLPNIEEGFEVKPVLITYSAKLELHDGSMTGLVNVVRSGDQRVSYFAKMLRVRVQLQFTDLEFDYKYLAKVMNIGPTGNILGSLEGFTVVFDVLIDFNNDEIQLQEFNLIDIGRLKVRVTGNNLIDWLINPIIGVFVRIFDDVIMRAVQANIVVGLQAGIDQINSNLKEIIREFESHNFAH